MLIILPGHLAVSGVTSWAVRTVDLLRAKGERAGLLVHVKEDEEIPPHLEPFIVGRVVGGPPLDARDGHLESLIPIYRAAIESIRPADGSPTLVAPSVPGDCYGVLAAIAQVDSAAVRVISWIHADNGYDSQVSAHYEPMIHAFVPVSRELCEQFKIQLPFRASDVRQIDHAVDVPVRLPNRGSLEGRPLRLVYTGRVVEEQKRVSALSHMAEQLSRLGLPFELRVAGDGPALEDLRRATSGIQSVTLLGRIPPAKIASLLAWADSWVLPSRYEGQSVAMLEAMAAGCVPIMTRINSGVSGIVLHGERGLVADSGPDDTPEQAGIALARAAEHLVRHGPGTIPARAAAFIAEHHAPSLYAHRVMELVNEVRAAAPRPWPTDRPAAFSGGRGLGNGSTPADAGARLDDLLHALAGRRVLIYGTGRHTVDLASVLARHTSTVVGLLDDHAPPAGSALWGWRVARPSSAEQFGASDVVISSYVHEAAIWANRSRLEERGLTVHRLYESKPALS